MVINRDVTIYQWTAIFSTDDTNYDTSKNMIHYLFDRVKKSKLKNSLYIKVFKEFK